MQKVCRDCGVSKPLEEFSTNAGGKHGRKSYCKPCNSVRVRAWKAANPDKVKAQKRRNRLKTAYGMTPEQYDVLLTSQGGRCAICRTDEVRGNGEHLSVDHDHRTGEVRGLLCGRCNYLLGKMGDSAEGVRRFMDYLDTGSVTR